MAPFTTDDFDELSKLVVGAWESGLDRDWSVPAGTLDPTNVLVVSDSGAKQLGTTPPYKYSSLGTMDAAGLKIAKKINTFAGPDEKPTQNVYVLSVKITEGASSSATTTTTAAP